MNEVGNAVPIEFKIKSMAVMNFGGTEENVVTREEFPLAKAKEVLGWSPKYTQVEDIISSAWNFHKTHTDGYKL